MKSSRRSAGFTLLEIILAMVLLAMVASICYAAFHLGIRAVERGEVVVVTAQRLRAASDVLIRQVKSAVPYAARNEDEEVYPYFFGTATSMQFITAAGLQGGGGLTRVVYRLEDNPPKLVLEEYPYFSPDSLGRNTAETVGSRSATLLDGFRGLRFEFLLSDGADFEWRQDWDSRAEELLPTAVRITIEGFPGLEVDTWGQEIPIMASTYSEGGGEVNDEDIAEPQPEASGTDNGTNNGTDNEPAEPDDEPDEDAEDEDEE